MLGCRNIDSPMIMNTKLLQDQGEILEDIGRYRRLVGKLTYVTKAKSDITFSVNMMSQFLSASRTTYLQPVIKILRYLKKALGEDFFIQIMDTLE